LLPPKFNRFTWCNKNFMMLSIYGINHDESLYEISWSFLYIINNVDRKLAPSSVRITYFISYLLYITIFISYQYHTQ
jgi:hypothetical protein